MNSRALVIQADKLPGGVSYLTDDKLDSLRAVARKNRQDHVYVSVTGPQGDAVPFMYRGRACRALLIDPGPDCVDYQAWTAGES